MSQTTEFCIPRLSSDNIDLGRRLREDDRLRALVKRTGERLAHAEALDLPPHKLAVAREQSMAEVWKACGGNCSLLLPHYFPRYPRTQPFNMLLRPFNMILLYLWPYSSFTLRGSRQTGKSTSLACAARAHAEMFENLRQLYVAPHSNPLETFARKYLEVSKAFINPVTGSQFKQNMYYCTYPNRSTMTMARVMTSSTPVRGVSGDVILFDENQLFDPDLELEVLEVLQDSDIRARFYAGTSTTSETMLEIKYQEGTQGTWNILLDDGRTVDCGDPEAIIPCIGEYFLKDPKTGKRLDPLRGFYRFHNPAAFLDNEYSVHIPQIINPKIANDPLEWNGIYRTLLRDRKKCIQEKLGIPVEEADREVTEGDLKRICTNPDGPEERRNKARRGHYLQVVSAFDWGGSDLNTMLKTKVSYTVHVILGLSRDGHVDILHMKRHTGKDYKAILLDIIMAHCAYGATSIASDFGGGQVYHSLMRSDPRLDASRHVVFDYTGPDKPLCRSPKTSDYPNMLMLNRTESLTMLFLSIVMADPILRAPLWDEAKDYLEDFLHIRRVLTDSEKGITGRKFVYHRHGAKSDDVVHALNLGYMLLLLCNNQALVVDTAARNLIRHAVYGNSAAVTPATAASGWGSVLSNYAAGR